MSWGSVTLAAYVAATGHDLRCGGCGNIITAQSRPPVEIRAGVFAHPNSRCERAAEEGGGD